MSGGAFTFRTVCSFEAQISRDLVLSLDLDDTDLRAEISWDGRPHDEEEDLYEDRFDTSVGAAHVVLSVTRVPPPKAVESLMAALAGSLPASTPYESKFSHWFQPDGVADSRYSLPIDAYSSSMQQYLTELSQEFSDTAARVAAGLRSISKQNIQLFPGKSQALTLEGRWRELPYLPSTVLRFSLKPEPAPLLIDDLDVELLSLVLRAGLDELPGHLLLAEARRAPTRAQLVLAVTAIEVHLKQFLAEAAPQTSWFLENTATPPIVRLLAEYLPTLALKDRHGVALPAVPPHLLVSLKKAVAMRNAVVHQGSIPSSRKSVTEVLDVAEDLLWLLDLFRGHEWVRRHIREETLIALGPRQTP